MNFPWFALKNFFFFSRHIYVFRRPSKGPYFVYKVQSQSTFSLRVKMQTFLTYMLYFDTAITNNIKVQLRIIFIQMVKAALPLSIWSVGCKNITLQYGRVLEMTPLSCNKSSNISRDVLVAKSFVPTRKTMISGCLFQIGMMWWLIYTKVASLKSCTFTKRFLLSLFHRFQW